MMDSDLLWSQGKCNHHEASKCPLDGENMAESNRMDVWHENTDNTEGDSLHEYCEEDQTGLDWCTKFDRRNLLLISLAVIRSLK